jgi:hypothetical protein
MGDHICPVCGAYGVSFRDKVLVRLVGHVLTCQACGVQLTVGFWESIPALIPLLLFFGLGVLFDNIAVLIVCVVVGLLASWLWSIRYVPLMPIGYRSRPK